ncbi:MAG TPA: phosphatidylinositol mannoside acyltransferase [Actinomycetes bacterium]|nr:phosphatidylinositol mannoside acyltransferase [Actinomycetes bacterium]
MRDQLADAAYAGGWSLARHAPESWAKGSFRAIADQAWRRRGPRVQQLERNLQRVVPTAGDEELRQLSRDAMRSYLRYWCETFRLPTWEPVEVVDRMVVHHEERFVEYRERGRGLIAVLGHLGNWDHCGAWSTAVGVPLTTVAERLRPESLFDRFVAYRESLGMEVLPLTGGPNVAETLRQRLSDGGFVCLLADRELSGGGVEVDLLGQPARFPAGPALLAARTGATLMPTLSYYDPDRTHVQFLPEIVVPDGHTLRERVHAMTQQFADVISAAAREHPTDWHMLQRVWSSDLERPR